MTSRTFPAARRSNRPARSASPSLPFGSAGAVVAMRSRTPIEVADAYHRELDAPSRTISCDDCVMVGTDACSDCVVSFLLALEPRAADAAPALRRRVELTSDEADTLALLQHSGLAPASNFAVRPVSFAARR